MYRSCRRIIFALSAVCLSLVSAHTYLDSLIVNGQHLAQYDGIRPFPSQNKEYPIADVSMKPNGLSSNEMICGALPEAGQPANRKISVAAGTAMGFQWWHTTPGDDVIASSHEGPCTVYMAKSDSGSGPVWFKIWEQGFNPSTRRWCVDDLIANRGVISGVTIPADIAPGNYLIRAEIIALHDANKPHGAQPYVHCAELTVSGSGSASPSGLVDMTTLYNDANLYIDLYNSYSSFTIPGPAPYVAGAVTAPAAPVVTPTAPSTPSTPSMPATTSTTGSATVVPSTPAMPATTSTTGSDSWTVVPGAPETDSDSWTIVPGTVMPSAPSPTATTSSVPSTPAAAAPSSSASCSVGVSQTSASSWAQGSTPYTQYNVVLTNAGSSTVSLTAMRFGSVPGQYWNIAHNADGTFSSPSWMPSLAPGATFTFGYIVQSNSPVSISVC